MFKIRHELDDTIHRDILRKGEKMTMYDLQYYIYRVTRKYGKTIEQCDTIRAIIDDQFNKQTSSYFNNLFLLFVLFFVLPYMTQINSKDEYFVKAAVIISLFQIA